MAKKILVIDDEKDFVETVGKILHAAGYETEAAYNGEEALAKIRTGNYDMVTLDLMMPGKNGFEVLREMRTLEDEVKKNIPVVIISARQKDVDIFNGYKDGGDYYLTKPFKMQTLVNLADYLIGDITPEEKERIEREL